MNLKKHTAKEAPLEVEKISLTEELNVLRGEISREKETLADFTLTKEDLELQKEALNSLLDNVKEKAGELQKTEAGVLQAKSLERDVLGQVAIGKKELEALSLELKKKKEARKVLSDDISALVVEREKLNGVVEEKEKQQALLVETRANVTFSQSVLNAYENDIKGLRDILDQLKNEATLLEQDIASKSKALEDREGDVSLRESWLLNKENQLRVLKNELEEYYGRKFKHIII